MAFDDFSISDYINNTLLVKEGTLGCTPDMFNEPIQIVPPFRNTTLNNNVEIPPPIIPSGIKQNTQKVILRIWFSMSDSKKWFDEAERFLRQMSMVDGLWSYEILGNSSQVIHQMCIPKNELQTVKSILESVRSSFTITIESREVLDNFFNNDKLNFELLDFYPSPPFYRSFPILNNETVTPFLNLYNFFQKIPESSIGGLQVLVQSANKNADWHNKIYRLIQLDKSVNKIVNTSNYSNFDSTNIPENSNRHFLKCDNNNKMFAFKHRCFIITDKKNFKTLKKMLEFASNGMHQYGKKYLTIQKEEILKRGISIKDLIKERISYSLGCIVTQSELATFCHFPTGETLSANKSIDTVSEYSIPAELINNGSMMGISKYAGKEYPICIPDKYRNTHCEILGKIRQGKTTLISTMILEDIKAGHGVGLIYPHEVDLINKLLQLIPKKRLKDVIFINPSMKDYVLAYNHFDKSYETNPGKLADDFTNNIRNMYPQHWGANMENIFRHLFYALNVLPNSNFFDIPLLLNTKNKQGDYLRKKLFEILNEIDNPEPVRFWTDDLKKNQNDLKPILNKFSALLLNEDTARVFAYRGKPKFDLRRAMDEQKIVIIFEPSGILGSAGDFDSTLYISDFYYAAMSRSDSDITTPFYLYIDELHRYTTKDIGDILRECSKFGLCLTIANQQRNQLTTTIQNDMGNIGNFITLKTNYEDAKTLERQTAGDIKAEDLVSLDRYNFIAHINGQTVRGNTVVPELSTENYMKEIIENNIKKYYVPESEISYSGNYDKVKTISKAKRIYDTF